MLPFYLNFYSFFVLFVIYSVIIAGKKRELFKAYSIVYLHTQFLIEDHVLKLLESVIIVRAKPNQTKLNRNLELNQTEPKYFGSVLNFGSI